MSFLKNILILLSISPFFACFSHEESFLDPVIVQLPEMNGAQMKKWALDEVHLECTSWRVAVEANNLSPWETIPEECGDYVQEYMTGKGYGIDLQRVSNEAAIYAKSVNLSGDGKDAWVFDVDETLISNLPYYHHHGYGLEIFDSTKFDEWVETGMAPAIEPSLKLYEEVLNLGFKVILLTGRSERHRSITVENLSRAGFREWEKLILRSSEDHAKTALQYKSDKRDELVGEGYRIMGNSGDQWSDLLGSSVSERSFKLSNPIDMPAVRTSNQKFDSNFGRGQ
ncbi:acid phosphatase 1 [Phtheirospermum japonicum]|uniref:Acid phosphatase 1 n=1 Tax=Phtheirospermum japonicum TaxID=374723 RepID=A0A830CPX0_9LAMI|nr:acid phosphatase 1 [Phtheirospermum japonicum]